MKKTDWTKVISKLEKKGYTQMKLAEITELQQGTISLLKSGKQDSTHYDAGKALMELLK